MCNGGLTNSNYTKKSEPKSLVLIVYWLEQSIAILMKL